MAKITKKQKAENQDKIIEKLKPFLQRWLRINRAIMRYNLLNEKTDSIATRTVYQWIEDDELFRTKIKAIQDSINIIARTNVSKKIEDWDYNASWKWLQAHEPEEFWDKKELTLKDNATKDPIWDIINKWLWKKSIPETIDSEY